MTEASAGRANMGFIGAIVAVATIGGFLFGYDSGAVNGAAGGSHADLRAGSRELVAIQWTRFHSGVSADRMLHRRILRRAPRRSVWAGEIR